MNFCHVWEALPTVIAFIRNTLLDHSFFPSPCLVSLHYLPVFCAGKYKFSLVLCPCLFFLTSHWKKSLFLHIINFNQNMSWNLSFISSILLKSVSFCPADLIFLSVRGKNSLPLCLINRILYFRDTSYPYVGFPLSCKFFYLCNFIDLLIYF